MLSALCAWAQGTGSVSGSVTSAQTRNALQGAIVAVQGTNRTVLTDEAGRYTISNVAPGTVTIEVSYSGFTTGTQQVAVAAGQAATADLALASSDVVAMQKFTVEAVREGQALALTEQRNAPNVKTVTAFDEWGVLPTQNVGELVSRLPGITYTTDEDNLINNVSIGGMPASYTRLNIDGMSATGVGGDGRTATLHSFSASLYEQVEIIAGQTPDKRADSLGGQLNLKSASPLGMKEKRRFSYTLGGRWFPSWSDRSAIISERPIRPDVQVGYTEVFDVAGGSRNLGVSVIASYQKVINPHDSDTLLYEGTLNPGAQLRDYTRLSGSNERFLEAVSLRADYQFSRSTRISARFQYNGGDEPYFNYTAVNPWVSTNLTINSATNPTGAIVAGSNSRRTEVLPVNNAALQPGGVAVGAAQMRLNPQRYSFTSKNPTGTLAFEHNWNRLKVDHAYRWSNTAWNSGAGRERENGALAMRTQGPVGFVLDYSNPRGQVFTQTGGVDVYDLNSYRTFVITAANATTQPVPATSTVLTKRDTITDTNEVAATVNAQYLLPTELPITIKTGLDTINRRVNNRQVYPRRWYGVAGTVAPNIGLMPLTEFERQHGGRRLPVLDPAAVSTTLNDPALWYEDVNFTATSQYTNRRIMEEGVDAAYIQASIKWKRLSFLGGVRNEWVTTDTFTYFRSSTTPIAVEPDHFKRAALDYSRLSRDGDYSKSFPSFHLSYDITANLKARASWSTSYGRPPLASMVAGATPAGTPGSTPPPTVTIGNPGLRPQMGENLDLRLDFYHDKGAITLRGYRKNIKDYISNVSSRSGELIPEGVDNGFDGLYAGYELVRPQNIGDAKYQGLELDFRQRMTFLPGPLKGLTLRANYTYLKSEGRFGGTLQLANGQVAGFIPRAYNVGVIYRYNKFTVTYDVNYIGRYPFVYSSAGAVGNRFREERTIMNTGVTYDVRRDLSVFVNLNNIEQEGPAEYIYTPDRPRSMWITPRSVKFGVTGRF